MSRLVDKWRNANKDLGVEIIAPFCVSIGNDVTIRAELLVKGFGAPKGMLIFTDYSLVKPYVDELLKLGYGFSVLEEPRSDESYDRDTFVAILSDWSWSGSRDRKPGWIADPLE